MPGMPVKFASTVKISARYISVGSKDFFPILNAGTGDDGDSMASYILKIEAT